MDTARSKAVSSNLSSSWMENFYPTPSSQLRAKLERGFGQSPIRPPIRFPNPITFGPTDLRRDLLSALRSPSGPGTPGPGSTSWTANPTSIPNPGSTSSTVAVSSTVSGSLASSLPSSSVPPPVSSGPLSSSSFSSAPASDGITSTNFGSAIGCEDVAPQTCYSAFVAAGFDGPSCFGLSPNPCTPTYGGANLCSCWLYPYCPEAPPEIICSTKGTVYGGQDVACCYANGTALVFIEYFPCICQPVVIGHP